MEAILYVLVGLWMIMTGYNAALGVVYSMRHRSKENALERFKQSLKYIHNPDHAAYVARRKAMGLDYGEWPEPSVLEKIRMYFTL